MALRGSRRPVRHHDQPLAHLPGVGADQRLQPLLRVHARGRLRLQSRVDQPDEVPPLRRQLRLGRLRARRRRRLPGPGDRRGAVELSDRGHRPNARAFRQIGLGYANLGALLMSNGLPYDSDEGRSMAAAITALMTGRAYRHSAEIAASIGTYEAYGKNREPHNRVMRMHRDASYEIDDGLVDDELLGAARTAWDDAVALGDEHGYRNAQATVLAPTGTISFLMDCDTTGIEPDFSLVKFKELVGGGQMTIVNRTVPMALGTLGYSDSEVEQIEAHINEKGTIIDAPELADEHLPVFDVAVGERAISHMGHIKMMAAVQPFISGAISKTVNLPED